MSRISSSCLIVLVLGVTGCSQPRPQEGEIQFTSSDGVKVFADWNLTPTKDRKGTILVFNQGGGDVRGEYQRILPRLLGMGYDVLATDLRRGGDRFGNTNRTAPPGADSLYSYCDAYPDVQAAVAEATQYDPRPILWGSSFSAALVIQAAAKSPDVAAVLAFSPATGDPMEGCRPEAFGAEVRVPLLVVRPEREAVLPSVQNQLAQFEAMGHLTWVAAVGTHGSSVLDSERAQADVEENWRQVEAFLSGVAQVNEPR